MPRVQQLQTQLHNNGVISITVETKKSNNMSYQPIETEKSQKQLQNIFKQLNDPLRLLGGWELKEICKNSRIMF